MKLFYVFLSELIFKYKKFIKCLFWQMHVWIKIYILHTHINHCGTREISIPVHEFFDCTNTSDLFKINWNHQICMIASLIVYTLIISIFSRLHGYISTLKVRYGPISTEWFFFKSDKKQTLKLVHIKIDVSYQCFYLYIFLLVGQSNM